MPNDQNQPTKSVLQIPAILVLRFLRIARHVAMRFVAFGKGAGVTCKPTLTPQAMADFLMHHYSPTVPEHIRNDYRRRSLELFEQIHEPSYAKEVRRLLEQMFRESKKKNAKRNNN